MMGLPPAYVIALGSALVAAGCLLLLRNWFKVAPESRGTNFGMLRRLSVAVIVLAGLAACALVARDVMAGQLSIVGWPMVLLVLGLSGFPRGAALR